MPQPRLARAFRGRRVWSPQRLRPSESFRGDGPTSPGEGETRVPNAVAESRADALLEAYQSLRVDWPWIAPRCHLGRAGIPPGAPTQQF